MIKLVYIGTSNPTVVTFYRDGELIDFSAVDRFLAEFRENDVVVDTTVEGQENLITSTSPGIVTFNFGDIGLESGVYSLQFTVYDPTHYEGQIVVGFDDNLKFRFVEQYAFDLVVQDDLGTQTDANAYIDIDYFKLYHNQRGGDFHSYDDFEIKRAIVRATDYVDLRFDFVSTPLTETQNTYWPRVGYSVLPRALREAVAEYALRALTANINPDPENLSGGRLIKSKSEGMSPFSESVTYDESSGAFMMPNYPAADEKIKKAGLIKNASVNFLMRG